MPQQLDLLLLSNPVMTMRRFPAFLLMLLLPVVVQAAIEADAPAEASFFIFRDGVPRSGVPVTVGGTRAVSGRLGAVRMTLPPGRYPLQVGEGYGTELLLVPGERLQMIVSFAGDGSPPVVDLETSVKDKAAAALAIRQAEAEKLAPGLLRGRIVSAENQGPVANAQLFIAGSSLEVTTDSEGRFAVELPAGRYTLSVIHADYSTQTVEGVEVLAAKEVSTAIELTPSGLELEEFVVLSPYIEGSFASTVAMQRDTSEVTEVLGAEQMAKSGDSNAAAALQRATGLVIEDGKYVVVRGQPARYTMTLWNGSELPSPDPIRRVVPLDLFPTGVLAGIAVQKSYSADLPGGFGGGLVNLNTRGLPEEGFAEASVKLGLNTQSTFQQGLTHDGGALDLLGIDDGTRDEPAAVQAATASGQSLNLLTTDQRNELGRQFSNNWQVSRAPVLPDHGLALKGGKRFRTSSGDYGILGSLSWDRKFRLVEQIDRDLERRADGTVGVLSQFDEARSDVDIGLGGLLVMGGKWDNHELTSNSFLVVNTTKRTEISEGLNNTSDGRYERNYLLEWNQRQMLVQQFLGKHEFDVARVDWRLLTAAGQRYSPDRRTYSYVRLPDGSWVFFEEAGGQRRFNTVDDQVDSYGLDLTFPLRASDTFTAKLKTGLASYSQDRVSETSRYRFEPNGVDVAAANPEVVLHPDNIGNGLDFADDTQSNDDYLGSAAIHGRYLMFDLDWSDRVRLALGARQETARFNVQTFQSSSQGVAPIVSDFTQDELLPASTITWGVMDDAQLRAGYSRTVARPMLVELSQTLFYDPDNGDTYLGNPGLKPAVIDNLDVRLEWYPSSEESVSLAWFRRDYSNPIETNFISVAGGGTRISLQNAEAAVVSGVELGGRLALGEKAVEWTGWDAVSRLSLQGNYSAIASDVTLPAGAGATSASRPLQGQADYVFNLQLGYDGERHDWAMSFNQVGERLDRAGVMPLPDIYREATPSLDAAWTWKLDKDRSLKLKGTNLLDPEIRYIGEGVVQKSTRKGVSVSLSFSAPL